MIKGHLLGNSLVPAKLIVGVGILLPALGIGRVQEGGSLEGKTQGTRLLLDLLDGTQQGQIGHPAEEEDFGGPQDALFRPLRQNDMSPVRFGLFDQGMLKHDRRDPCRAG